MTRDEIIKTAKSAGWEEFGDDLLDALGEGAMSIRALERFASMVAAHEREQCAQVCGKSDRYRGEYFAAKIRARGMK